MRETAGLGIKVCHSNTASNREPAELLAKPRPGMLLLADRNFAAGHLLKIITGRGPHLLVRAKTGRGGPKPPVLRRLRDGSCRSVSAASRSG